MNMHKINSTTVYIRLLKYSKKYYHYIVFATITTLISSGIDAGIAYYIAPFIDTLALKKDPAFLSVLPLFVVLIFLVRALISFTSEYFMNLASNCIVMNIRQLLFNKILFLPAYVHDKKARSEIMAYIINNVNQVSNAATNVMIKIIREGALLMFLLVVMFSLSWKLALLSVVITPIIIIVVKYTSKRLRKISFLAQNAVADMVSVISQSTSSYKLVCIFGTKSNEIDKFSEVNTNIKNLSVKSQVSNSLSSAVVQLLVAAPISFGIILVTKDNSGVTLGAFTAILVIMSRLLGPIKSLSKINGPLQAGIVAAHKIFELYDMDNEIDDGLYTNNNVRGEIEFKNVNFTYNGVNTVLNNLSLHIKPGQTIAFVGGSGSGKTTLVNLLPRLYRVNSGEIVLDGHNINEYTLESLRNQFTYVGQDAKIFRGTVYDNIIYGCKQTPTEQEIEEAITRAKCKEFIAALPDGIYTVIGDDGELLSGGQRQRLAIARAIIKDAPIIIFDEATSSLDTKSECYIKKSIEKYCTNKTVILIAHRLSTVVDADHIYVLDNGVLVEHGNHKQLLAKKSHYAKLYNIQDHN
ncbi:MAG: ATP-binding cassette domain-containing protein [Legionellales bacterium]|jgi:ATP-binding cassette, subfamily B, bacterial MsbA|nr:ATP-binding cassette domain-containing protein [Legionellales bacterium]